MFWGGVRPGGVRVGATEHRRRGLNGMNKRPWKPWHEVVELLNELKTGEGVRFRCLRRICTTRRSPRLAFRGLTGPRHSSL